MSIYVQVWEKARKASVLGEKHHLLSFPPVFLFSRIFPESSAMIPSCKRSSHLAVKLLVMGKLKPSYPIPLAEEVLPSPCLPTKGAIIGFDLQSEPYNGTKE